MPKRLNGKINIEVWPIEMMWLWKLDVEQLPDGRVLEPGKMLERQIVFLISDQEPKPVLRDIRDFNVRNVLAKLGGFHLRVPE